MSQKLIAMRNFFKFLLPFSPAFRKRMGILTVSEAAELIGVDERLVVKGMYSSNLPYFEILGHYYFEREKLISWKQYVIAAYAPDDKS